MAKVRWRETGWNKDAKALDYLLEKNMFLADRGVSRMHESFLSQNQLVLDKGFSLMGFVSILIEPPLPLLPMSYNQKHVIKKKNLEHIKKKSDPMCVRDTMSSFVQSHPPPSWFHSLSFIPHQSFLSWYFSKGLFIPPFSPYRYLDHAHPPNIPKTYT